MKFFGKELNVNGVDVVDVLKVLDSSKLEIEKLAHMVTVQERVIEELEKEIEEKDKLLKEANMYITLCLEKQAKNRNVIYKANTINVYC